MADKKVALVLSGGGSRGAYEAGVWQALKEMGIKIDIVTGASVGAINGVMVAQGDLDLSIDLWKELETHMVFDVAEGSQTFDYAKEFVLNNGTGSNGLHELMKKYIDEDKVRKSNVEFGLVAVELPMLKGHFLFKEDIPEGKLIDYTMASASAYPAVQSYNIDGKDYIDGGYADVLPVKMALSKGATEVIAVYLEAVGIVHPEDYENLPNFTMIKCPWDLGNFLVFDKDNSRRIMRFGYLDAMKAYGVFEGEYFTFAKGTFDKRTLKQADAIARIFELDPTIIYRENVFMDNLQAAVTAAQEVMSVEFGIGKKSAGSSKKFEMLKPAELFKAIDSVKDIVKLANRKTATLMIASNMRDKGSGSLFLSRHAIKLMPAEINAAKFLIKNELI